MDATPATAGSIPRHGIGLLDRDRPRALTHTPVSALLLLHNLPPASPAAPASSPFAAVVAAPTAAAAVVVGADAIVDGADWLYDSDFGAVSGSENDDFYPANATMDSDSDDDELDYVS